ncbi:hypothetical protein LCGC14_0580800 [marine sediment metagenome]|uniref:3D domain-containing protein n=1 Tax=marine sediment metagenome TaxID=412755 RepID=A0A0F9UPS5_9ZZZZ
MKTAFTAIVGLLIVILIGYWCQQAHQKPTNSPVEQTPTVTILMNVSAYCPCERCCGDFADGITASGVPAEGYVIAAPRQYAFGTLMTVPGYADGRPVKVLDRGGAIKGNRLDVFFATHQEALNWGRQYLKVEVIHGM